MQGSLVTPFMVCLPLCLVSSFLFRSRLRVAPFFGLPSGCCRNTKSLCDWLMPGSFCWCRRREKSLALFLRIPPARGEHRSGQGCGGMNPGQGGNKVPDTCTTCDKARCSLKEWPLPTEADTEIRAFQQQDWQACTVE